MKKHWYPIKLGLAFTLALSSLGFSKVSAKTSSISDVTKAIVEEVDTKITALEVVNQDVRELFVSNVSDEEFETVLNQVSTTEVYNKLSELSNIENLSEDYISVNLHEELNMYEVQYGFVNEFAEDSGLCYFSIFLDKDSFQMIDYTQYFVNVNQNMVEIKVVDSVHETTAYFDDQGNVYNSNMEQKTVEELLEEYHGGKSQIQRRDFCSSAVRFICNNGSNLGMTLIMAILGVGVIAGFTIGAIWAYITELGCEPAVEKICG